MQENQKSECFFITATIPTIFLNAINYSLRIDIFYLAVEQLDTHCSYFMIYW